jgi:hypothetical protein
MQQLPSEKSYILEFIPEVGKITGFESQEALLSRDSPEVLYSIDDHPDAVPQTDVCMERLGDALMRFSETPYRYRFKIGAEARNGVDPLVQRRLAKVPKEALDFSDRSYIKFHIGNLAITQRRATIDEEAHYSERLQDWNENIADRERLIRVGLKYRQLVNQDHLKIGVSDIAGQNEKLYVLPLGDPNSIVAARTLLYLARLQADSQPNKKPTNIAISAVAIQALEDMSADERAMTLTREWQRDPKSTRSPIIGHTTRILKQLGAGTGIIKTGGSEDYVLTGTLKLIALSQKPFDKRRPATLIVSPDAALEPSEQDAEMAADLLKALGTHKHLEHNEAIDYLYLAMTGAGKDAIAAVRSRHFTHVDANLKTIHDTIRHSLGTSAYRDALANRTIGGNTFSGGKDRVRLTGGAAPYRTKVNFGDARPWRFKAPAS